MKSSGHTQGRKTHEQQKRILECKPDLEGPRKEPLEPHEPRKRARHSEFPVSRHGMNQESEHNKHNHPYQGAK